MSARSARLEKLEERVNRLNELKRIAEAEIQKIKNRNLAAERKKTIKKNSIIGAMIMQNVAEGKYPREKLIAALDAYVTNPKDRQLFDELQEQPNALTAQTIKDTNELKDVDIVEGPDELRKYFDKF